MSFAKFILNFSQKDGETMKRILILLLSFMLCTVPCMAVEESGEDVTGSAEITIEATTEDTTVVTTEKAPEPNTEKTEPTTKKSIFFS